MLQLCLYILGCTDESWKTMEWIVKTLLKGKTTQEMARSRDKNGATVYDLVDNQLQREWKTQAPFSYKSFGFE